MYQTKKYSGDTIEKLASLQHQTHFLFELRDVLSELFSSTASYADGDSALSRQC
jgi:hypothetical protein